MGGLSRRAYLIKQITSDKKKPALILDAGALLFEKPAIASSQLAAKKIQAEGIVQALHLMKYNAIGLSSYDLAAGAQFIMQMEKKYQIPFLSLNLTAKQNKEPLFKPYQVIQTGDLSIAVIGLTGIEPDQVKPDAQTDYSVIAWQDTLRETLNDITTKVDMVILLSSFPEQKNRNIALEYPEIHLILQSGNSSANRPPANYNNTLITQVGSRGKFLGKMSINWSTAKKWDSDFIAQMKTVQDRLDRTNWQIDKLKKRYQNKDPLENPHYSKLIKVRDDLTDELDRLKLEKEQAPQQLSSYKNTFVGLKMTVPEERDVLDIVNKTKQDMNNLNRAKMQKMRSETDRQSALPNMAGWKSCDRCHPDQTEFWKQTPHANAWQTLEKANQQYNQDCLICHVTLPTYDHETVMRDNLIARLSEEFHNVTCESCHGPGREHAAQPDKHPPTLPDEKTCLNCHTPDHDTDFDYERKVQLVRCPAS